jgi:hypothetical protein
MQLYCKTYQRGIFSVCKMEVFAIFFEFVGRQTGDKTCNHEKYKPQLDRKSFACKFFKLNEARDWVEVNIFEEVKGWARAGHQWFFL